MAQERKCAEGYLVLSCFKIKPPIHNNLGIGKIELRRNHQTQPSCVSFEATGLHLLNYLNCAQYVYFTITR